MTTPTTQRSTLLNSRARFTVKVAKPTLATIDYDPEHGFNSKNYELQIERPFTSTCALASPRPAPEWLKEDRPV